MNKINRFLVAVIILIMFSSCSEQEEHCNDECYVIKLVEGRTRNCNVYPSCNYTFRVTFENECTGEWLVKSTVPLDITRKPEVGELVCNDFNLYR